MTRFSFSLLFAAISLTPVLESLAESSERKRGLAGSAHSKALSRDIESDLLFDPLRLYPKFCVFFEKNGSTCPEDQYRYWEKLLSFFDLNEDSILSHNELQIGLDVIEEKRLSKFVGEEYPRGLNGPQFMRRIRRACLRTSTYLKHSLCVNPI